MRSRSVVLALCAAVTAAVTASLLPAAAAPMPASQQLAPAAADERPNFVILQTDDMTVEDLSVMPAVKRLIGREGATMTRTMTPFAICCPSRAAMMSGCYPHNNGVNANFPPEGGYQKWEKDSGDVMIASWLKGAGYHTAHIGKYINGYAMFNRRNVPTPKGWSEWHGSADPSTYRMWGYRLNEPGGSRQYGRFDEENPALYSTDVYSRKAQRIITEQASKPGPFMLQVAFLAPHIETVPFKQTARTNMADVDDPHASTGIQTIPPRPAPRHKNTLKNVKLKTDPSFNEADLSDKQAYIRGLRVMTDQDIQDLKDDNRQRKQSLLAVDEAVVAIMGKLRSTGQLDNTYVIVVGDNGYLLGQHRIRKGKYFPYEPALNIPFLMRGPGITAGMTLPTMTSLIDITPTILDLADVEPTGREPDGISLVGALTRGEAIPERTLLLSSGPQSAPNGDPLPLFDGVRTRDYAYWKYEDGFEELYDLRTDPYQVSSRASDPGYAAVKAALIAEWERMRVCSGASCAVPTPPMPDPAP